MDRTARTPRPDTESGADPPCRGERWIGEGAEVVRTTPRRAGSAGAATDSQAGTRPARVAGRQSAGYSAAFAASLFLTWRLTRLAPRESRSSGVFRR